MNRSWSNSSSPGFVYFNADSQKSPGDAENFISFQESPSSNNYSSNYNGHSSPSYGSPKFHSSPRKFNLKNSYQHSGGNRGNRSFHKMNKSWGNQRSPQFYNQRQNTNNTVMMSRDGSRDMSMFYDHTSTQNPWEHLEKQLEAEKSQKVEDTEEPLVNKLERSKVEEKDDEEDSSSSESEEGESDSSNSSCSSSNTTTNNEKEKTP